MKVFTLFIMTLIFLLSSVSHSEIRTSLLAEDLDFISPDYESTDAKNFIFVGATLKSHADGKTEDPFKINLTGLFAVGHSVLSYLNIREIYFTSQIDSKSAIHIGRKLQNWSTLDTIWNLGVYQPQFKWNALAPENQGLTGIFWNKNEDSYGLTLFASPIYIPDQGASYELKDGQFQSNNPWFQSPPQNIKFQNQLLPIDYNIDTPDTSKIVFQTQFGAQFRLGESRGFFTNIAGMYKPSNQLALGYKGVLVTTRVRIDITPKVYFENIYSSDFGYRGDWGVAQLSLLYSKPQNPSFDPGFNSPEFEESLSWGPQFLYKFKPFDLFIGYLDTSGGKVKDVGPDASDDRASLSQRFLFTQALQTQVTYSDIFWNYMKLESTFQYKFSTKDAFRQIRFKNVFDIRGPFAFWIDMLLIDTDSEAKSNMEAYKSQDQVWLGVSYDI
jgi:hypothetical protein